MNAALLAARYVAKLILGGKPTILDIQLIHCLSKINLISLFIEQDRHFAQLSSC